MSTIEKRSKFILAFVASTLTFSSGCTTLQKVLPSSMTSSSSKNREDTKASQVRSGEMFVVQQAGARRPLMSKLDRQQWINLRQTSKQTHVRAYAALAAGEWEVAIKEAREHLRQNPKDKTSMIILASALTMEKDYQLAGYYARRVENYHGSSPETRNILGIATLFQAGNHMPDILAAQQMFQEAMNGSSHEVAAGMNLGQLQLELGNANAASETFAQVKNRCHGCEPATMGLGIALSRTGQYDAARREFHTVIANKPNDPEALYRLALLEQNGYNNRKKAVTYLQQLMASNRSDDVMQRRASSLLRRLRAVDEPTTAIAAAAAPDKSDTRAPVEPQSDSQNEADAMMTTMEWDDIKGVD